MSADRRCGWAAARLMAHFWITHGSEWDGNDDGLPEDDAFLGGCVALTLPRPLTLGLATCVPACAPVLCRRLRGAAEAAQNSVAEDQLDAWEALPESWQELQALIDLKVGAALGALCTLGQAVLRAAGAVGDVPVDVCV